MRTHVYSWPSLIPAEIETELLDSPAKTRATKAYRSTVTELIHTIARAFSRPIGIAIVAGTTTVDDANSYCITIRDEYGGVVTFARASNTAATYTESDSSSKVYLSYAYDGLNVNTNEEPIAEQKIEKTIKRVTYFDYAAADNSTRKTVLSMVETITKILDNAAETTTSYETEQYEKYTDETGGIAVAQANIVVHNDEGHIITTSDYGNAAFFNNYTTGSIYYKFTSQYDATTAGTMSAVITLTTNKYDTDTYSLYSPRGYSIAIFVTDDEDVTTDITAQCTLIAKDGKTYVVDQQTGKIILVIHDEFISNDTSAPPEDEDD